MQSRRCLRLTIATLLWAFIAGPAGAQTPKGDNVAWVPSQFFPPDIPEDAEPAVADLELTRGPDDVIAGCRVVQSSGLDFVDTESCRLALGSRIYDKHKDPISIQFYWGWQASNADNYRGKAIPISPDQVLEFADYRIISPNIRLKFRMEVNFLIGADGSISKCSASSDELEEYSTKRACELIKRKARFIVLNTGDIYEDIPGVYRYMFDSGRGR